MEKEESRTSVLTAMSGGVDSSVAALLLQQAGYQVKGLILRLHEAEVTPVDIINGKLRQSIWYARETARKLHLHFTILDVQQEFQSSVIRYYAEELEKGHAPEPCVFCNRNLQFPQILKAAEQLGCEKIATGHFARVEYEAESGRYLLKKSEDHLNDQSFLLAQLSQEQLSKVLLPLGSYRKEEIRAFARQAGLKNASLAESADRCFVPDGNDRSLLKEYHRRTAKTPQDASQEIPGMKPGKFVDTKNRVLGAHEGYLDYQIGQQLLLEDSEEFYFVKEKRAAENEIVLAGEDDLYEYHVILSSVNYVSAAAAEQFPSQLTGKLYCRGPEYPAMVKELPDGRLDVSFPEGLRCAALGQTLVLYAGDLVLASGVIDKIET